MESHGTEKGNDGRAVYPILIWFCIVGIFSLQQWVGWAFMLPFSLIAAWSWTYLETHWVRQPDQELVSEPFNSPTFVSQSDDPSPQSCGPEEWTRLLSLRSDQIDRLRQEGHVCLGRGGDVTVKQMRDAFENMLIVSKDSEKVCEQIRDRDEGIRNGDMRKIFRQIHGECFLEADPADRWSTQMPYNTVTNGSRLPYMLAADLSVARDTNEDAAENSLRKHMRKTIVDQCQKYVTDKTNDQIMAYVEHGDAVEKMGWWNDRNLQRERVATEVLKHEILRDMS
jgi:hypothetical protein